MEDLAQKWHLHEMLKTNGASKGRIAAQATLRRGDISLVFNILDFGRFNRGACLLSTSRFMLLVGRRFHHGREHLHHTRYLLLPGVGLPCYLRGRSQLSMEPEIEKTDSQTIMEPDIETADTTHEAVAVKKRSKLMNWLQTQVDNDQHLLEVELTALALQVGIVDACTFPKFHCCKSVSCCLEEDAS